MPVYFAKRSTKFTFHAFSEEMPPLLLTSEGARGALLSVLACFFERGHWGSPIKTGEGHSLTAEDRLFILMEAGPDLAATRGFSAPETQICYERAETLCHSLN